MKTGSILGDDSLATSLRERKEAEAQEGELLESSEIMDPVVVMEDGCGSSILVDFRGLQ